MPTAEAKEALESLKMSVAAWTAQLEAKKNAINTAATGRNELVKQLTKLAADILKKEHASRRSWATSRNCWQRHE